MTNESIYQANQKTFIFSKEIREHRERRLSFDALSQETFGLSFEEWYKAGFWTDKYQPYTLSDGERVVANASVNIIDTVWEDLPKRYVQIGTVMTAPEYRHMGLSGFLINRIFDDWLHRCNAVYLFANDSVLDFYPKFGFVKANQYQATIQVEPRESRVRKLDMADKSDVALLHTYYQKSNPFSVLPMKNCWGLLMFYCSAFMKDCVYYVEDSDAIVIAEQDKTGLTVFDVFTESEDTLSYIISAIAHSANAPTRLGFSLKGASEDDLSLLREENTTLFVFGKKENLFQHHKTMFPLLSHA